MCGRASVTAHTCGDKKRENFYYVWEDAACFDKTLEYFIFQYEIKQKKIGRKKT